MMRHPRARALAELKDLIARTEGEVARHQAAAGRLVEAREDACQARGLLGVAKDRLGLLRRSREALLAAGEGAPSTP